MRPKERIPTFIELIDWKQLIEKQWKLPFNKTERKHVIAQIKNNIPKIIMYWAEYPDERIGQVLVNMGIISNVSGMWYYMEDDDILIKQGHKPEDVCLWGTYGKDGKQPFKRILIRDMSTEHMQACIDTQPNINPAYKELFEKLIKERTDDK